MGCSRRIVMQRSLFGGRPYYLLRLTSLDLAPRGHPRVSECRKRTSITARFRGSRFRHLPLPCRREASRRKNTLGYRVHNQVPTLRVENSVGRGATRRDERKEQASSALSLSILSLIVIQRRRLKSLMANSTYLSC
ncbi:PREDICTED: uncharacterized protein LOC108745355 [Trachymyrmex septentrionalis]|uniref:uncharacterized protein LOC108745355 n=1 Tax=Trachymyrmex septentrionalis TaxID=34720 RepID=UPI00084F7CAB|nr:PREDICTED: uncharacterized protein LOC108745355 [Trachymyrmex septentrionalis]